MSKAGEKPHKIHLETWRKRNWLSTIWADPSYSVNRKYIADVKAATMQALSQQNEKNLQTPVTLLNYSQSHLS